ncbi:MAG: DUF5011 domain-containing protein, partial [Mariprofundaceae bacterium]|nr:DUF5011 domain-containing protein [Mariprofundaceae bacterium]
TDAANNVATTVVRDVYVQDTTKPVITTNGADPYTFEVGLTYADPKATVTDNVDATNAALVGVSNVVNTVVGNYTVTYNHTDAAGNVATTVVRDVYVQDTTLPVITTNGTDPYTFEVGLTYVDPLATMTDNVDATNTFLTGTSNVVSGTVGNYTVTYNYMDAASNVAMTVVRDVYVQDITLPVITANGADPYTFEVGLTYVDPLATVTDNVDATNAALVGVSNVVNTVVGNYTVTYNHTDAAGNAATTVVRDVYVQDTILPVITANGADPYTFEAGLIYVDPLATMTDNVDATNAALVGVSSVNNTVVGNYTVTYNYTDAANNVATTVVRDVYVQDTTAPVFTNAPISDLSFQASAVMTNLVLPKPLVTDLFLVSVVSNALVSFPVGATVVTWVALDASGNISTSNQTIIVTPQPVMSSSSAAIQSVATLGDAAVLSFVTASSANNINTTVTGPSNFPIGINSIMLTETSTALGFMATDNAGTSSTLNVGLNNGVAVAQQVTVQRGTVQPPAPSGGGCHLSSQHQSFDPTLPMMIFMSLLWLGRRYRYTV